MEEGAKETGIAPAIFNALISNPIPLYSGILMLRR
jgi:hypothetical protein